MPIATNASLVSNAMAADLGSFVNAVTGNYTFPAGSADGTRGGQITWSTATSPRAFTFYQSAAMFNGTRDDFIAWGYNYAFGQRLDTRENAIVFGLETHYYDGSNHWQEWNLDTWNASGVNTRVFGMQVNRNTAGTNWKFLTGNDGSGQSYFGIGNSLTTPNFQFQPNNSSKVCHVNFDSAGSGVLLLGGQGDATTSPAYLAIGCLALANWAGTGQISASYQGNFGFGMTPITATGPVGIIGIANATTTSLGTPSGGGYLYVESGALKYKGSSGTITVLGSA